MRSSRFFALSTLFALAWLGCEWASEKTPDPVVPVWGAELTVAVLGKGSVASTEPGLRCPSSCYARFVPNLDAAAPQTSITLRATPDPGFRFLRWQVDPTRIGGRGTGPDECNPIRRPAQNVELGSAAEVTLPFGQVEGYPPPGLSEKCAKYSQVPLAYNLTAIFEPITTATTSDVWATLSTFESVQEILLTSTRVIARVTQGSGLWRVVLVSVAQPTVLTPIMTGIDADAPDVAHHFVFQDFNSGLISLIHRDTGVLSTWQTTPAGTSCRKLTSNDAFVYCRTIDQQLLRWTITGQNQTTLFGSLPSGDGMTATAKNVFLVTGGGTGFSILKTSVSAPDAGPPGLESVASNLPTPRNLRADDFYLYTVIGDSTGDLVRFTQTGGSSTAYSVGDFGLFYAPDPPIGDPLVWVGASNFEFSYEIRALSSTLPARIFRTGLPRVTGLAVDDAFVYWTQGDGRIFRGKR